MTSRDFCFWLQGYFELNAGPEPPGGLPLSGEQSALIKRHLALVFKHEVDPSMGDAKHQATLNAVHRPPQNHGTSPHPQGLDEQGRLPGGLLRC